MDRGAWQATVCGVIKSLTQLRNSQCHFITEHEKLCGKSLPNPPEGGHSHGRSREGIDLSVLPLGRGEGSRGRGLLLQETKPH